MKTNVQTLCIVQCESQEVTHFNPYGFLIIVIVINSSSNSTDSQYIIIMHFKTILGHK